MRDKVENTTYCDPMSVAASVMASFFGGVEKWIIGPVVDNNGGWLVMGNSSEVFAILPAEAGCSTWASNHVKAFLELGWHGKKTTPLVNGPAPSTPPEALARGFVAEGAEMTKSKNTAVLSLAVVEHRGFPEAVRDFRRVATRNATCERWQPIRAEVGSRRENQLSFRH